MEMTNWRNGALLASLLLVVGFFSTPATCQQPQRRPRDRVIAAQDNIPVTSFTCANKTSGYYADIETDCQVYHMCDRGRQFSYRCPNTTLFQQRMLICAHWYQVNCSRSEQHYSANLLIGQRDKPFVEESDYINIYLNGKGIKTLKNPDDLQKLNNGNIRTAQKNQEFQINIAQQGVANQQVKVISTQAIPPSTQTVFTNTNQNFNFQSSNQNLKSHTIPTQTIFINKNPNINGHLSSQSYNSHVVTTPKTFIVDNPGLNAQFSSQNFKPHVSPTQTSFTKTNPTFNIQFSNQNFQPFESQSKTVTPNPVTFQTRITTAFVPFTKQVMASQTPQIQFQQKTLSPQVPSHQDTNLPIIQTNEYNNFIKRFNPDFITEAIIKDNRHDEYNSQYNNFIKRFNPYEVSLDNKDVNSTIQNTAISVNTGIFNNRHFETPNLEPPVPPPSSDFEVPIGDTDQMESNNLELRFQDPRQAFFIPESDSQIIPAESATPLSVSIPRNVGQQFHPMLFVNSASNECFRCHPSFIINKANCTPCVVIR